MNVLERYRPWIIGLLLVGSASAATTWELLRDNDSGPFRWTEPAIQAEGEASGLEFSDIRLLGGGPDQQAVVFDLAWTTDEFPGVRRCGLEALDEQGRVVGRVSDIWVVTRSPYPHLRQVIEVQRPVSSVEGLCGRRLDVGRPYAYEFSDVTLDRMSSRSVRVSYHMSWLGHGYPGLVNCTERVRGADGKILFRVGPLTLLSEAFPDPLTHKLISDRLAQGVPETVDISCRPFVTSDEEWPGPHLTPISSS